MIEARIEPMVDREMPFRLARPESIGRAKRVDDVAARCIEFAK